MHIEHPPQRSTRQCRRTFVHAVWLSIMVSTVMVGCAAAATAPPTLSPTVPPTSSPGSTIAPSPTAHMAHESRYGGQLGMSKEMHIEIVSERPGEYKVYLFDLVGDPLPPAGIRVEVALINTAGDELQRFPAEVADNSAYFIARGGPTDLTPIDVRIKVFQAGNSEPVEMDFVLQYQTEATPVPTLAATPTRAPNVALTPGVGPCAHDYFPLAAGNTWTYRDSLGTTYSATVSDLEAEQVILVKQFPEATTNSQWACQPEGLAALEFGGDVARLPTGLGWTEIEYKTESFSGVTLPTSLNAGAEWEVTYEVSGESTPDSGHDTEAHGTVSYKFKVVGPEAVSVPAGTFDGIKIQLDISERFDVTSHGAITRSDYTYTGHSWLAPGVGWVKTSINGEGIAVATELQSYAGRTIE